MTREHSESFVCLVGSCPHGGNLFPAMDGPNQCPQLLEKACLEYAQGVLAILVSWLAKHTKHELASEQELGWSPLVRFVGERLLECSRDPRLVCVEQACALILWDHSTSRHQEGKVGTVITELNIQNAIPTILSSFAKSPLVGRRVQRAALECTG